MAKADVRPTRDGDQFHYWWAARRCLRLIHPQDDLVAITIEDASCLEDVDHGIESDGDDAIDMAEYRGSQTLKEATSVSYIQLKHSTRNPTKPWPLSGLAGTLTNFGKRYSKLIELLGVEPANQLCRFEFVTNRPISKRVTNAIELVCNGPKGQRRDAALRQLIGATGLNERVLPSFLKRLVLEAEVGDFIRQRAGVKGQLGGYLAGPDRDAPIQLKELITKKATTEYEGNPAIIREDVLDALGVDEGQLFPAGCLISTPERVIPRKQEIELVSSILSYQGPTIIEADGGVGKSIFATQISSLLPTGSATFVYDCFGNGTYLNQSGLRHRAQDGLVQIANEMAANELCDPLVPNSHASQSDYVRAFLLRVEQASESLRTLNEGAVLCIVVDAADNAEQAAREFDDPASFARALLRESIPENAKLVMLCRPYRTHLLKPPPSTQTLRLRPFNLAESRAHLRQKYPSATQADAIEFHRLSSQNPRVQALVLSQQNRLDAVLAALGPEPTTVESLIEGELSSAIANIKDGAGELEQTQIDMICVGLATLKPLVPLDILAKLADVPQSLIRSLVNDLRHPLLVLEGAVQFKDEPSENWFHKTFRPEAKHLSQFVSALAPLAGQSTYAASALPSLMLEAGQFEELVDLALSDKALPQDNPVDRRDISLRRLQFAIKAAIRRGDFSAATKLTLKAGGEAAGDERQQSLTKANTDLAAAFLSTNQKLLLISRRLMPQGSWHGSRHAYEAALLSGDPNLHGDARSRLRMAYQWLERLRGLSPEEREKESIDDEDISELALTQLNVHGPVACAKELRRWQPREAVFRISQKLAQRLIDLGRIEDVQRLAVAAGNNFFVVGAVNLELAKIGRSVPAEPLSKLLAVAERRYRRRGNHEDVYGNDAVLEAVSAVVQSACRSQIGSRKRLSKLLSNYLPSSPPRGLDGRFRRGKSVYLAARVLKASLQKEALKLSQLAYPELRKGLRKKAQNRSRDFEEFSETVGSLLPWYYLWADTLVGRVAFNDLPSRIDQAKTQAANAVARVYGERANVTFDEITELWSEIIFSQNYSAGWEDFSLWQKKKDRQPYIPTILTVARRAGATSGWEATSIALANQAFEIASGEQVDAEQKADTYVEVARAVFSVSKSDSEFYFSRAIEVASKIGQENLSRWEVMLTLALSASKVDKGRAIHAKRLSRCAELTYAYVVRDKHFPWEHTVEALCELGGPTVFQILSRWRDRAFGDAGRLLTDAIEHLLESAHLSIEDVLPLVTYDGHWNFALFLRFLQDDGSSDVDKRRMLETLYRYMKFSTDDEQAWALYQQILEKAGGNPEQAYESLKLAKLRTVARRAKENDYVPSAPPEDGIDWDAVFEGISFSCAGDLEVAMERRRELGQGYWREDLLSEMLKRVAPRDRVSFLEALSSLTSLSKFDLRALLEAFPSDWGSSPSVLEALKALLRRFATLNPYEISVNRYYQILPLERAIEVSGIDAGELVRCAVGSIGDTSVPSTSSEIFQLADMLASLLAGPEASDALDYGIALMERFFDDDCDASNNGICGDGIASYRESLAGYIWSVLGSPVAADRWEAAHSVRAIAALGNAEMLTAISRWDCAEHHDQFGDAELVEYRLHSRLWFVTALRQAAFSSAQSIAALDKYLEELAGRSNPHVMIRGVAAATLLTLNDAGALRLSADRLAELRSINEPRISKVRHAKRARSANSSERSFEKSRFSFGIDFGPYWLNPLARVFGIGQAEAENAAEAVILDDWKADTDGRWASDLRAQRGYFSDRASSHSHGSRPKVDDLQFYLSYHAMFTIAGSFLQRYEVGLDDYNNVDLFTDWMNDQSLHNKGSAWLSDYRDLPPIELIGLPETKDEDWLEGARSFDSMTALERPNGCFIVAGRWTLADYRKSQTVSVASALVSKDKAASLARALVSEDDAHNYKLPDAGEDMEISLDGFQLLGWLKNRDVWHKSDEADPWAAELTDDFIEPSMATQAALNIEASANRKSWHRSGEAGWLLMLRKWSEPKRGERMGQTPRGDELVLTASAVEDLLAKTGKSLIIEVQVDRSFDRDSYSYERKGRRKKFNGKKHEIIVWSQGGERTLYRTHI